MENIGDSGKEVIVLFEVQIKIKRRNRAKIMEVSMDKIWSVVGKEKRFGRRTDMENTL